MKIELVSEAPGGGIDPSALTPVLRRAVGPLAFACSALLCAATAAAAEPSTADALSYRARVDVVSQLFRRRTFPGVNGTLVAGDFAIPLYQYALLDVRNVDAPWREDSVDFELAAWGNLQLAEPGAGRVDGDIHVASVRQRFEYAQLRFGRQVKSGGATRYAHFDGVSGGAFATFPGGARRTVMGVESYGGFAVLPRWNARPGYQQLGSVADSLLRDPAAIAEPAREESWLAGGRAYVTHPSLVTAGVSFHEQHTTGGLDRRNGAVDLQLSPIDAMTLHTQAILDIDAGALADVRAGLDIYPMKDLSLRLGYQHLSPALLLSRQSVLSVFSTEAFDEWGIEGDMKIRRWLRVGGFGYALRFDDASLGARVGGNVHATHGKFAARAGYRRISESANGYHGLRASVIATVSEDLRLIADTFVYLYDAPIQTTSSSIVGVFSVSHHLNQYVEVMASTSVARTPYALLDVQGTARASVAFEGGGR